MPDRLQSTSGNNRKLINQLIAQLHDLIGLNCEILLNRERPWASITFSGTRHLFAIACAGRIAGDIRETLETGLCDHEFDLPGHFVADALVKPRTGRTSPVEPEQPVLVEILTIADPVA